MTTVFIEKRGAGRRIVSAVVAAVLTFGSTSVVFGQTPQSPPQPTKTEILTIEAWRVTCSEYAQEAKKARTCIATTQAVNKENGQAVLTWNLGIASDGTPISALVTLTGVSISKGVDLKIGSNPLHKLTYSTCEPNHCTLQTLIDQGLRKELLSSEKAEITVYGSTGATMTAAMSIKGIDRVLSFIKP